MEIFALTVDGRLHLFLQLQLRVVVYSVLMVTVTGQSCLFNQKNKEGR